MAAAVLSIFLSGCSTLDSALTYVGLPDEDAEQVVAEPAPVQPVATSTAPNEWCARVAASEVNQTAFDAATKQRMTITGYNQCMAMSAR